MPVGARYAYMWVMALMAVSGCAARGVLHGDAKESTLTPGMVELTVQKGKTTQADILEAFGPPDQVTHRDGKDIWTYDRIRYATKSDAGSLIFYSARSTVSQSTSTLLILYFNDDERVYEYKLDTYRF